MRHSRRRQVLYILMATFVGTGYFHFLNKQMSLQTAESFEMEISEHRQDRSKDVHIAGESLQSKPNPTIFEGKTSDGVTGASSDMISHNEDEDATKELVRLYDYLQNTKRRCEKLVYIGKETPRESFVEGTFPICLDWQFWPEENQCLVYSYGINDNWGFEDGMAELFGCENHAFDAHMYDFKDHRHSRNVWFHRKALGNRTSDSAYSEGKNDIIARDKWGKSELERLRVVKMRTLDSMMTELGHNGKTVDILRLDAEATTQSYEFDIIRNLVETGTNRCVRQLTVEAHFFGHLTSQVIKEYRDKREILRKLEDSGFELLEFHEPEEFSPEHAQDFVTSLTEQQLPLVFVMLWGSPEAEPCRN
uniref:Methyltransferase-like protein 24 n=1 Tax=Phallusia mammillata TaxID=59560 RepID=A0A6F9DK10_9ASCI|nr:methyltransferase-like protein 24 [Phallusia mammillata]